MYKKLVFIFIAALMGACTPRQQADEKTLYVSILPLRSLVEEIVGDDFKIEVLVPLGASPETFEPTPRQFIGLNRAEMIFNVGLIDFETPLLSKIEERGKVVNLSQGIELIAGSCSHACTHAEQETSGGHYTAGCAHLADYFLLHIPVQCTGISQAEFYAAVESLQINGIDLRRSEASSEVDGRIRFPLRHNLLLFPGAKEQ